MNYPTGKLSCLGSPNFFVLSVLFFVFALVFVKKFLGREVNVWKQNESARRVSVPDDRTNGLVAGLGY
jgi:hypothetical protein